MRTVCVIPSRYGSTRLPAKPLADICGKPMVRHVYENAAGAAGLDATYVATDDARIVAVVEGFGGKALLTSPDHASGTDRVAEVASRLEADIYVNVQGDEPFVRHSDVSALIGLMLANPHREVGSLCQVMAPKDADNPNAVKVVLTHAGDALYFSRLPIPFLRKPACGRFRHVGFYAYRRSFFERYATLPPSPLAEAEQLEQLRFLQAGIPIVMGLVSPLRGPAVDTREDLDQVRAILSAGEARS